jgi:hypothetical protein
LTDTTQALVYIDNNNYELTQATYGVYGAVRSHLPSCVKLTTGFSGVEWYSDPNKREDGRITWVADGKKSWEMLAGATGPNAETEIGARLVSEEPMAMVSG